MAHSNGIPGDRSSSLGWKPSVGLSGEDQISRPQFCFTKAGKGRPVEA